MAGFQARLGPSGGDHAARRRAARFVLRGFAARTVSCANHGHGTIWPGTGDLAVSDLYDRDFYAWACEQAGLLREGHLSGADVAHIAEEIETLGRNEKRELRSRLSVLFLHLLKWRHQPGRRGRSWELSIANARDELAELLADSPSLRATLPEAVASAYRRARLHAEQQTGLPAGTFPPECPWTFDQAVADELPGP